MDYQITFRIQCLFALLTLSLLAACGGGGGGGSAAAAVSGKVMDGYIKGATVCLDLNKNGVCDSNEPTATTGTDGSYSFNAPAGTNLSGLNVIAQVPASAVDSDNPSTTVGTAFTLLAPAIQPLVVTPLTTLVSQYIEANPTLSAQDAASSVVAGLGLPSGTNLFQDYIASSSVPGNLHGVAQVVNTVMQNTNLTAASAVAIAHAPAAAAASGVTVNLANLPLATQLNTIRQYAGAGLVSENTALDTAATSHANYLIANNLVANTGYLSQPVSGVSPTILGGHYEDPTNSSLTGYTGSTPSSRATAAGYTGSASSVGELLSFGASSATSCSASIENSVYHLINLIWPFFNDIGLTYNNSGTGGSVCDIELGVSSTSQLPLAGSWVFYPGSGQTGVPPTFYNQSESPVPAPNLQLAGHPIVMSLYNQSNTSLNASDLVLNTFTLSAAGSPVSAEVLAQSGVTTTGTALTIDTRIPPGVLVLLPTSPLHANTSYTVTLVATVKTTVVSKTWSFTTGSAN